MLVRILPVLLVMSACATARNDAPRQLLVVSGGMLQRYERASEGDRWREAGAPFPVVVGRNGVADPDAKVEGDGKAPSGTFPLGTAFGFADRADTRMPYRQLRETTECVDDTASRFYNQIVERDAVTVDWTSSEKMRAIAEYRWGIVVEYNTPPVAGKGSCIFLHLWSGPDSTTAGCTAMAEENLLTLLRWLDPAAKPVIEIR
jgi:zinc D-Ala-D-Ala dipeptidase